MAFISRDSRYPILPPELCDTIIDHCSDHRAALSACSLVSRLWLPRSRSLLFHAITLSARNAHALCALLASAHCTIAPFVQSCTIFPRVPSDELEALLCTVEQSILSRLQPSSITTICIPPQWLHGSRSASLASNVTSLSVVGLLWYDETTTFSDKCRQILEFVGAFTLLERLEIGYETPGRVVPFSPPQNIVSFPKISLPRLRRLQLGDIPYNVFLPWFLVPDAVDLPNLSYLSFYVGYADLNVEAELLQEFLDVICSPTVEELSFWLVWESLPGKTSPIG